MNPNLILISLSLMTWGVGEGMFIYFQPLYLQELGASPVLIGSILGIIGISMTITHLPAGYLADKFGRRPVLWAAWIIASLAAWIMALSGSLPWFVLGASMYGLTAFVMGPLNSYITAAKGKYTVARALTLISATYNIGAVIGPLIGGWIGDNFGLRWAFVLAGAFFLASTALIFQIKPQPIEPTQPEPSFQRLKNILNKRFVVFLIVIFFSMLAMFISQPLSQNFLQNERNLDLRQIGLLISARSVGVVLFNLLLGQVNAKYGFLLAQALTGLFSLFLWQGTSMVWYLVGYIMIGNYQTARSLAAAQGRSLFKTSNMGIAFGLLESVGGFVAILAPPFAGFLYAQNPSWPYIAGIIAIIFSLILAVIFIPVRADEVL